MWAWMVQLKTDAALQGPDNSKYLKGFQFWVKWAGEVSHDDFLPLVHVIHRA